MHIQPVTSEQSIQQQIHVTPDTVTESPKHAQEFKPVAPVVVPQNPQEP